MAQPRNNGQFASRPLVERFEDKYTPEPMSGCWLWTAGVNGNGYGAIRADGRSQLAHRVAWQLYRGPIPHGAGYHGTCVLHRCDNPVCVNPDHLFLGSNADNAADKKRKGRARTTPRLGEDHPAAKLNEQQVLAIRADKRGKHKLAREYDVSPSLIGQIKRRIAWRHI